MRKLKTFLTLSLFILAAKVHAAVDCELRLAGDAYFGIVRACLKADILTLADLDRILESKRPINPLETATRTSKNAAAITGFAQMIEDPKVKRAWRKTLPKIEVLRDELTGARGEVDRAREATKYLLRPEKTAEFTGHRMAIDYMHVPSGETFIVSGGGTRSGLEVLPVEASEAILLDYPEHRNGWSNFSRIENGELWLYILGSDFDLPNKAWRMNFSRRSGWKTFDAAEYRKLRPPAEPKNPEGTKTGEYQTKSGGTLSFTLTRGRLEWTSSATPEKSRTLKLPDLDPAEVTAFEAVDGQLNVFVRQEVNMNVYRVSLYRPDESKKALWTRDFGGQDWGELTHFFNDPSGLATYVGFYADNKIRILDVQSLQIGAEFPSGKFLGWYSTPAQTYVWYETNRSWHLELYRLFSEIK